MNQSVKNKLWLILERYYPFALTVIVCTCLYFSQNNWFVHEMFQAIEDDTFLTTIIAALSIAWGFLLNAFTLLLQSNSKAIMMIHSLKRFPELVNYNKVAVYYVFATTILTSILLLLVKSEHISPHSILKSVWTFLVILCIFLCYRFLRLFYKLITEF